MIPDNTGRFPERPHYEIEELEEECEAIIESLLMSRYGQYAIAVPTEAFVELLERETAKLNIYCDLSAEGEEVHGVTEFFPGYNLTSASRVSCPTSIGVSIANAAPSRTSTATCTGTPGYLYRYCQRTEGHKCLRAQIIIPVNGKVDWLEWHAGFISGAMLMPHSRVQLQVGAFCAERRVEVPLDERTIERQLLIQRTGELFRVSSDAARVRLRQRGYLVS
jgi:hypothetical protein